MNKQLSFRKLLHIAQLLLISGCGGLYLLDLILGNGDGVIDQLGFNLLSIFLFFQLLLLLLYGMSSQRPILSNLSTSGFSFLVLFVLIEVGFRFFSATYKQETEIVEGPYYYKHHDPIYFKTNRPSCSFKNTLAAADGGSTISVQINSDGVRGPEIPVKEVDQQRVLLLGDSYLQAIQVPYEQTIGEQMKAYQANSASIIQHGFPSYSPLLEFNWLLRKGMEFEPDQVLLFVYMNDFFSGHQVGDAGYWPYTQFDQRGYPKGFTFDTDKVSAKRTPLTLLREDFEDLAFMQWSLAKWKARKSQSSFPVDQFDALLQLPKTEFSNRYRQMEEMNDPLQFFSWDLIAGVRDTSIWDDRLVERMDKSLSVVKNMNRFLSEKGIAFGLVFIPFPWQLENEGLLSKDLLGFGNAIFPYSGLQAQFQQFCMDEQIPFLDLYADFLSYKKAQPNQHLYYPNDQHWTANGHRLAAEKVYEFFLQPSISKY